MENRIPEEEIRRRCDLHEGWLDSNFINGKMLRFSGQNLSHMSFESRRLRCAHFKRCNLRGASFLNTDLRDTVFRGSDLRAATLSNAILHGVDLSDTKIRSSADWILENAELDENAVYAYKVFGYYCPPSPRWAIKEGSVLTEQVNPSRTERCACGINVATRDWVLENCCPFEIVWKVWIPLVHLVDAVVPYNTDGKWRVGYCELVEVLGTVEDLRGARE